MKEEDGHGRAGAPDVFDLTGRVAIVTGANPPLQESLVAQIPAERHAALDEVRT